MLSMQEGPDVSAVTQIREVCHDMRQPVAGMLALTAAAMAEPGLPQAARTRLEQIAQQAQWLGDLIGQWLDGANRGVPSADQTDLVRAANEAAAAERLTWPGEATVTWAEPVRVAVHPVLVRRVLGNVLSNATRAAGPTGRVLVEVAAHGRWATLTIEDSGPGFGRIAAGSGFGLPAVARTVARCGGRIECGGAPGGGARVTVRLPSASRRDWTARQGGTGQNAANVADCS